MKGHRLPAKFDVAERLELAVVALGGNAANTEAATERKGVIEARELVKRDVAEHPIAHHAHRERDSRRPQGHEGAQIERGLAVAVRELCWTPRAQLHVQRIEQTAVRRSLVIARVPLQAVLEQ